MTLSALLSELPALYKAGTNINSESWYLVAAVVITTLNQPQDIPQLYQQVSKTVSNYNDRRILALRLKEAIFKSSPIIGLPKVINSLSHLHASLPSDIKQQLPEMSQRSVTCWEDIMEQRQRGQTFFNTIYDRHAVRVMDNLNAAYPDLAQSALEDAYGKILSNTDRLDEIDTSFIVIAGLMVQDLPSQLKGHYYGSMHNGATVQQLFTLQTIVEKVCAFYNHLGYCSLPLK